MDSSPPSLDPRLTCDRNSRTVMKSLFEGLTRLNGEGEPDLGLAKQIDISEDGRTYTFRLRPSHWSDGQPVIAEDFAYAWRTLLGPSFPTPAAQLLYPIQNAQAVKRGEAPPNRLGIEVVDDQTLVVRLCHPTPYFLELIAHPIYSPVPAHVVEHNPDWASRAGSAYVCNGPYCPTAWEPEYFLTLERNPSFWAGPVALPGLELSFVQDADTALLLYEREQLDWMGTPFHDLPLAAIPEWSRHPDYHHQQVAGIFWYDLNTRTFPLSSVTFRAALVAAIDREALAALLQQGPETVTGSLVPRSEASDPNQARALLQKALQELDIDVADLPPLKILCSDVVGNKALAQAVQQQWRCELGVDSEIHQLQWNHYIAALQQGDYQVAGHVYDAAFDDVTYHANKLRYPTNNSTGWESAIYQRALEQAEQTSDPQTRDIYLNRALEVLSHDHPILPICFEEYKFVHPPSLTGVVVTPTGQADFRWARWQKAAK